MTLPSTTPLPSTNPLASMNPPATASTMTGTAPTPGARRAALRVPLPPAPGFTMTPNMLKAATLVTLLFLLGFLKIRARNRRRMRDWEASEAKLALAAAWPEGAEAAADDSPDASQADEPHPARHDPPPDV